MSEERPKLLAKWEDDCLGKKNYDGVILRISTRYWPRTGSLMILDRNTGQMKMNPDAGMHSARCSLEILDGEDDDEYGTGISLIEADFRDRDFSTVKNAVEKFAQEQMDKAVKALKEAFYVDPNGSRN